MANSKEVARMDLWTRWHAAFGGEAFDYAMGLITGVIG
jgi:hypothetical protein